MKVCEADIKVAVRKSENITHTTSAWALNPKPVTAHFQHDHMSVFSCWFGFVYSERVNTHPDDSPPVSWGHNPAYIFRTLNQLYHLQSATDLHDINKALWAHVSFSKWIKRWGMGSHNKERQTSMSILFGWKVAGGWVCYSWTIRHTPPLKLRGQFIKICWWSEN